MLGDKVKALIGQLRNLPYAINMIEGMKELDELIEENKFLTEQLELCKKSNLTKKELIDELKRLAEVGKAHEYLYNHEMKHQVDLTFHSPQEVVDWYRKEVSDEI